MTSSHSGCYDEPNPQKLKWVTTNSFLVLQCCYLQDVLTRRGQTKLQSLATFIQVV